MTETNCEVCAKPLENSELLLCEDCSYAFAMMLKLLQIHPALGPSDLDRIKEVLKWRTKNTKILDPRPVTESSSLLERGRFR